MRRELDVRRNMFTSVFGQRKNQSVGTLLVQKVHAKERQRCQSEFGTNPVQRYDLLQYVKTKIDDLQ